MQDKLSRLCGFDVKMAVNLRKQTMTERFLASALEASPKQAGAPELKGIFDTSAAQAHHPPPLPASVLKLLQVKHG